MFNELEKTIQTDFLNFTATVGIPGESAIYAELLVMLNDLHEVVEFPYLANKNILAIGGEFSAGKSRFLNAILGIGDLLPTDPNPTTAIPTYLTYAEEEKILALNTFNRSQVLSRAELNAISHGFNANQANLNNRVSFYHILKLLQVQSPRVVWQNIAFLDTPGYSKPKENAENEEEVRGTDAGNTDEEKARVHLTAADYLIWVVSAADGTFHQPGIEFLGEKVKWTKPLYLLVNKADQKTSDDLPFIFNQICKDAHNAGFNVAGASAYSSRECKVYMGDDPMDWFRVINDKIKLTKWRGRFKAIMERVIRYCDNVETRYADYENMLKRVELEPDINGELSEQVRTLRKGISDEREKRTLAIGQFAEFGDKIEKLLDSLLHLIGISDETAADVGLVAVSIADTRLMKSKKGDRFVGTITHYSRFNGCYLKIPGFPEQVWIRRSMIEKVTNPTKVFVIGNQLELIVYEINFAQGIVTFNIPNL